MTGTAAPALGIFARTFSGSAPRVVLQQARAAGFGAVQYNMACSGLGTLPTQVSDDAIAALRTAVDESGVELVALSATYNMIHPDPAQRRQGQLAMSALAAVAQALSIPCLTVCTGSRNAADQWSAHPDNATPGAWDDLLVSMTAALDATAAAGTIIAIEPEPGNVVASPAIARRLIDTLGHPRVGVVLDLANLLAVTELRSREAQRRVLATALEAVAERVVLVHAKDRSVHGEVVAPGQGAVDFVSLFDALRRAGVTVPVVTHGLAAADAADAASYLRSLL